MRSVDELIISIQNRISLPLTDEDRWNRSAVISTMNEVLQEQVAPKLIAEGGEFLVHREVLPLVTAGLPTYPSLRIPMPRRTYGRAIREIKYIGDDGSGEYPAWKEVNVTCCSVAEADSYEQLGFNFLKPMVCITNDFIRLLGNPQSVQGAIVLYYYLEISDIVDKTTQYASISNLSYVAGTTTITAAAGTEFTTYSANPSTVFVDIYRKSTGAIIYPNVIVTRTGISTWTTTAFGDKQVIELATYQQGNVPVVAPYVSEIYMIPSEQSQFSTIPEAFDSILVLETCSRILESLGDVQALETNAAMLKKAYDSISISMGNRLNGQQKRVSDNRTLGSFQRNSSFSSRFWGRFR